MNNGLGTKNGDVSEKSKSTKQCGCTISETKAVRNSETATFLDKASLSKRCNVFDRQSSNILPKPELVNSYNVNSIITSCTRKSKQTHDNNTLASISTTVVDCTSSAATGSTRSRHRRSASWSPSSALSKWSLDDVDTPYKFNEALDGACDVFTAAISGCKEAETISVANNHRPCFKNLHGLCVRAKSELQRPDNTVANIDYQGIPRAMKDFIYSFVRLTNSWIVMKSYLDRPNEDLAHIEPHLSPGIRQCFSKWQTGSKELMWELISTFSNLDIEHTKQRNTYYRTNNATTETSHECSNRDIDSRKLDEKTESETRNKPKAATNSDQVNNKMNQGETGIGITVKQNHSKPLASNYFKTHQPNKCANSPPSFNKPNVHPNQMQSRSFYRPTAQTNKIKTRQRKFIKTKPYARISVASGTNVTTSSRGKVSASSVTKLSTASSGKVSAVGKVSTSTSKSITKSVKDEENKEVAQERTYPNLARVWRDKISKEEFTSGESYDEDEQGPSTLPLATRAPGSYCPSMGSYYRGRWCPGGRFQGPR